MPTPRLLAVMFALALLGGAIGALITLAVSDRHEDERGTVVRVASGSIFWEGAEDVWCNEHHRFCIPRFDDPSEARAFYQGDTHDPWRQGGCFVEWRPDFPVDGQPGVPPDGTGAFRGVCSGSTFLSDGTRVFGPSPRNLDEFPITVVREIHDQPDGPREFTFLEVDTRTLICGDWFEGYTGDLPDPECELAPPYD